METPIRHRRLHAFYYSKVLNALMTVVVVALLQIGYLGSLVVPVGCASLAIALFIGYSLWIWIGKPEVITINKILSHFSSLMLFYYLIVVGIGGESIWWYISPLFLSILIMFLAMIKPSDESFHIN